MTAVVWNPAPASVLGWCRFQYDNPVPRPECRCEECEECVNWGEYIECGRETRVRVELSAGYFDCCSPEAHGIPVLWWAPLVRPMWRPKPDHLFKYFYRDRALEALSAKQHPHWAALGK